MSINASNWTALLLSLTSVNYVLNANANNYANGSYSNNNYNNNNNNNNASFYYDADVATSDVTPDATDAAVGGGNAGRFSLAEAVVIGLVLSFIIFLSIAGNILVCVAVFTDRQLRKTSNYFIVSLAVADLLVSILVMTFATANDILGYWIFHPGFCSVWIAFDIMGSTASILNLCAISLDRYMHIRNPLNYETWMTTRRAVVMISAVWACSALISFLPIHLGWHKLSLTFAGSTDSAANDGGGGDGVDTNDNLTIGISTTLANLIGATTTAVVSGVVRVVNDDTGGAGSGGGGGGKGSVLSPTPSSEPPPRPQECMMELNSLYAVVSSVVSFYIPCVVMLTLYCKLYGYARKHVRSIRKQWTVERFNNISPNHKGGAYKVSDHKAAMTLGIIMGVFLFCWMPFFTINITRAFCPPCIPEVLLALFVWLGYVNSALNPIIYSIFNTEFRMAFKRVLRMDRCCVRSSAEVDIGKPIAANSSEYGTVSRKNSLTNNHVSPRKDSRTHLVEKITSL